MFIRTSESDLFKNLQGKNWLAPSKNSPHKECVPKLGSRSSTSSCCFFTPFYYDRCGRCADTNTRNSEGRPQERQTSVIVFLLASIQSHSLQNKNTKFIKVNFKRGGVQILLVYHFHSFRPQSAHQLQSSTAHTISMTTPDTNDHG